MIHLPLPIFIVIVLLLLFMGWIISVLFFKLINLSRFLLCLGLSTLIFLVYASFISFRSDADLEFDNTHPGDRQVAFLAGVREAVNCSVENRGDTCVNDRSPYPKLGTGTLEDSERRFAYDLGQIIGIACLIETRERIEDGACQSKDFAYPEVEKRYHAGYYE